MSNDKILPQTVGDTEECLRLLEEGIETHMTTNVKWPMGGVHRGKQELLDRVRAYRKAFALVRETEEAFHAATRARDEKDPGLRVFLSEMLVALECQYGLKSEKLSHFGFRARKDPKALTAEQEAEKVQKARRTRKGQTDAGDGGNNGSNKGSSGPGVAA